MPLVTPSLLQVGDIGSEQKEDFQMTRLYTVDGNLSDQLGAEVTESGGYYSKLSQEYDGVVVSSFFLSTKHSVLSSKEPGAKQPLQIVLAKSSGSLQLPAVTTTSFRTIIFRDEEIVLELEASQRGIETVVLDRMNLIAILEHCKRQGLRSVMQDLRGNSAKFEEILQEGYEQNLFQKVIVEVLPIMVQVVKRLSNICSKPKAEEFNIEHLRRKYSAGRIFLSEWKI